MFGRRGNKDIQQDTVGHDDLANAVNDVAGNPGVSQNTQGVQSGYGAGASNQAGQPMPSNSGNTSTGHYQGEGVMGENHSGQPKTQQSNGVSGSQQTQGPMVGNQMSQKDSHGNMASQSVSGNYNQPHSGSGNSGQVSGANQQAQHTDTGIGSKNLGTNGNPPQQVNSSGNQANKNTGQQGNFNPESDRNVQNNFNQNHGAAAQTTLSQQQPTGQNHQSVTNPVEPMKNQQNIDNQVNNNNYQSGGSNGGQSGNSAALNSGNLQNQMPGQSGDRNIPTDISKPKTVRWQEGQQQSGVSPVTVSPVPSNPNDQYVTRPNPIVVSSQPGGRDLESQNSKARGGFDILRFLCIIVLLLCAIFLVFLMVEAVGIL